MKVKEIVDIVKSLNADGTKLNIITEIITAIRWGHSYIAYEGLSKDMIEWCEANGLDVEYVERAEIYMIYWD